MQYAGFWRRLGAGLIDLIIFLPLMGLNIMLMYKSSYTFAFITIFMFFIELFYETFLLKKYGATIGKMIVKIKVIKLNGDELGWREIVLRNLLGYTLSFVSSTILIIGAFENQTIFNLNNHIESSKLIRAFASQNYSIYNLIEILQQIWIWSECVTVLLNKKKRAIHDIIAGTIVIVKNRNNKEQ